jgi:hypothetical protein
MNIALWIFIGWMLASPYRRRILWRSTVIVFSFLVLMPVMFVFSALRQINGQYNLSVPAHDADPRRIY